MTILVTGKNGQLGSELQALAKVFPKYQFLFTDKESLDVTKEKAVEDFFRTHNFDALINCAAYTDVDKAEAEPELANAVNHFALGYLAKACKEHQVKLIHISTDYVFDGTATTPYLETDSTNPQSVYGQSKLDGELLMKLVNPAHSIIIRTSWLYSVYGSNFVKTMMGYGKEKDVLHVVNDQLGSPTYAADLAKAIVDILPQLNTSEVETYHYANTGSCTWYVFAHTIFEMKAVDGEVKPIPTSEYPTPAQRPQYSVLNTNKIQSAFNIKIPHWTQSLKHSLDSFTETTGS
jgi:dTDP-4-dehydrorhamnose reductase